MVIGHWALVIQRKRAVAFALGSQGTAATTDALGVAVGTIDVSQPPQTVPLIASFAGDTL